MEFVDTITRTREYEVFSMKGTQVEKSVYSEYMTSRNPNKKQKNDLLKFKNKLKESFTHTQRSDG